MHTTCKRAAVAALLLLFSAFDAQVRAAEPEIAVVVKIGGIPWFTAMEQGIKKAANENHVKAYMVGPTTADPAQQVRAVEDLIAKKVSAIGVVPNDAKALEPVWYDAAMSLQGLPNVLDIRCIGITAGIDLASRPDAVGRRAYDAMVKAFHEESLTIRSVGETLAVTPPLIVSEDEIGEIFGKLAGVIRAVA